MLKDCINFDEECNTHELFSISRSRALEIEADLTSACQDIGTSFEDFSTPAECGHPECFTIHLGKCLEKISNIPRNENESLFLAFCFKAYLDNCKAAILFFKTLDIKEN